MHHVCVTIKEQFQGIYKQLDRMVEKDHVELSFPRTVARKMHHNNIPCESNEKYYRRV